MKRYVGRHESRNEREKVFLSYLNPLFSVLSRQCNWVSHSLYLVLISSGMRFSSSRSLTLLICENTTVLDMMTFVTTGGVR